MEILIEDIMRFFSLKPFCLFPTGGLFRVSIGKTYHGILIKDFIATKISVNAGFHLYTILKEQGFLKNKDFKYKFDSFPLRY